MFNIATAAKGWFGGDEIRANKRRLETAPVMPVVSSAASVVQKISRKPVEKGAMTEPRQETEVETIAGQVESAMLGVDGAVDEADGLAASSAYQTSAEVALILRAQTGDQAAFGELVELHQDFVYNLAYRILQDYEEADDATQEAFVKIWQALAGFRGDSKFTTWAYRIVRNLCLNRLRSAKSNPRTVSVETSFEDGEDEGREIIANLPGDITEEPAWRFDTNERRQLIWQEVDGLPVKYREIIGLYYNQELSYEEIAASLEVPVGTVKTHLYRAKALLKNKLLELNSRGMLEFGV